MNAENIGFPEASFDFVLSGFMGWYDCFDFTRGRYTRPDRKSKEIWRVLKEGGKVVICSWERQEDLHWMEQAFLRNYPPLGEDQDYIRSHPIGTAYENPEGYQLILKGAGFKNIEVFNLRAEFVSTTEDEWWEQMRTVGWARFFKKVGGDGAETLTRIREAIFRELQAHKHPDGLCFTKSVFSLTGRK
jgi:SAM-dependent methyltransferase